jgi:hypothetical protein
MKACTRNWSSDNRGSMDVEKLFNDVQKQADRMLGRPFSLDHEVELALFEWGLKKRLRLFGTVNEMWEEYYEDEDEDEDEELSEQLRVKGIFTDTSYKTLEVYIFDVEEKSKTIELTKDFIGRNQRWSILYARTKEFLDDNLYPVGPLYSVLVDRGIILPFSIKFDDKKEWELLPFEKNADFEPIRI